MWAENLCDKVWCAILYSGVKVYHDCGCKRKSDFDDVTLFNDRSEASTWCKFCLWNFEQSLNRRKLRPMTPFCSEPPDFRFCWPRRPTRVRRQTGKPSRFVRLPVCLCFCPPDVDFWPTLRHMDRTLNLYYREPHEKMGSTSNRCAMVLAFDATGTLSLVARWRREWLDFSSTGMSPSNKTVGWSSDLRYQ